MITRILYRTVFQILWSWSNYRCQQGVPINFDTLFWGEPIWQCEVWRQKSRDIVLLYGLSTFQYLEQFMGNSRV